MELCLRDKMYCSQIDAFNGLSARERCYTIGIIDQFIK